MYSFYRLMIVLIYLTPKDRSRAAGYTTDLYSTQFSLAFNFTVTVSILSETLSTARHLRSSWNNGSVSVRPYRFIIVRNILNCDVHGGYGFEPVTAWDFEQVLHSQLLSAINVLLYGRRAISVVLYC